MGNDIKKPTLMQFPVADGHGLKCGIINGCLVVYFLQDGPTFILSPESEESQCFQHFCALKVFLLF